MDKKLLLSIKELSLSTKNQTLISSLDLDLHSGEIVGICAPTGSGKSSLFNCIAGILDEDSFLTTGSIQKEENLVICYAFQEPRLIPSVTVLKNIMLPLENGMSEADGMSLACEWLKKLNLSEKKDMLPGSLSGGERQRAGLARAFAWAQACSNFPRLYLFDEPFASQDEKNIQNISSIIQEQNQSENSAFIIISHDKNLLSKICNSCQNWTD